MGGSKYSDEHHADMQKIIDKSGGNAFKHDHDVRTGKVTTALHDSLNILGKRRESRDSDVHPTSRAVAVILDQTGSMSSVPRVVQRRLPELMGLLVRKSYLPHPHLLVGAIGDAHNGENAPIQMSQFEGGNEIDEQIANIYLEGNGGGGGSESYELAMYFLARRTDIDCFEKRGEKGYLFIIGDEKYYTNIPRSQICGLIDPDYGGDSVDTEVIWDELLAKYEVFYIMPNCTHNYKSPDMVAQWQKKLGERVLFLDNPEDICVLIAATIGMCEGSNHDTIASDLKSSGMSDATTAVVTKSLATLKPGTGAGGGSMTVTENVSSGSPSGLTAL